MEAKQYLVFNLETTGLNPTRDQICHLSYIIMDDMFNPLVSKKFYFSVDEMSYGAMSVHGLTKEGLQELSGDKGFRDCYREIYEDFKSVDLIATHNLSFFWDFMLCEFQRLDVFEEDFRNIRKVCLMWVYKDVLKLEWSDYMLDYKYPRFSEIERFLELKREDIIEQSEGLFNLEEGEITRCISKTTSAAQMLKVYMLKEIEIF